MLCLKPFKILLLYLCHRQMNSDRPRDTNEFVTSSNPFPPFPCFLRVGNIPFSNQGISNTNDWMCHPCMLSVTHKVNMALAAERNNALCSQLLFLATPSLEPRTRAMMSWP